MAPWHHAKKGLGELWGQLGSGNERLLGDCGPRIECCRDRALLGQSYRDGPHLVATCATRADRKAPEAASPTSS